MGLERPRSILPTRKQEPLIIERGGKKWISGVPKEGPSGPYDEIFDFGGLNRLAGRIPLPQRFTRPRWRDGRILAKQGFIISLA